MTIPTGCLDARLLPDGRLLTVVLLTFGRGRLTVGPPVGIFYDDHW